MNKEDDLKWDNRELGADERYVAVVSKDKQKIFDDILNLVLVRFRMDKELYSELCNNAKKRKP